MTQGTKVDMLWDRLKRDNGTLGNSLVSYAVNNELVNLVVQASLPPRTDSGPPVTPFPIGTGGGA